MDAVSYIRERARMCKTIKKCKECPIHGLGCGSILKVSPEMILELVEQWSKEHPLYTNGQKFIEEYKDVITSAKREDGGNLIKIYMYADWWEEEYKKKGKTDVE